MNADMSALDTQRDALEIRRLILEMLQKAGSGHAAGPLDMADIFAVLYRDILRHDPRRPAWPQRDRVVLSNGHICPVLYATLALHGYFAEEKLSTLRQRGSELQGHPHENIQLGLETSSGPLGQGLSQAVGMGLAACFLRQPHHIYALLSDGEHQEGQTWEAYMAGAKYALSNLTVVIDRNFAQISGVTEQVMPLESLADKLRTFHWRVYEINGHDHEVIAQTLQAARDDQAPSAIVAYTEPGHGVSFLEGKFSAHDYSPAKVDAARALRELNSLEGQLETQYD